MRREQMRHRNGFRRFVRFGYEIFCHGHLGQIFDRYYSERRDETPNGAPSSYFGIGLWIARRNVEAMGGTIEAENRTPHGLAVHIRLPLAPGRG